MKIDAFGRIFAKQPLKAGAEVEFTVYAEDAGNPPLHGNAIVRMPVLGLWNNINNRNTKNYNGFFILIRTSMAFILTGRANRLTVSNRAPYLLHVDEWRELSVTDMDQLVRRAFVFCYIDHSVLSSIIRLNFLILGNSNWHGQSVRW